MRWFERSRLNVLRREYAAERCCTASRLRMAPELQVRT
jgi:hypothetical protein